LDYENEYDVLPDEDKLPPVDISKLFWHLEDENLLLFTGVWRRTTKASVNYDTIQSEASMIKHDVAAMGKKKKPLSQRSRHTVLFAM
jgi:hypothetical protein